MTRLQTFFIVFGVSSFMAILALSPIVFSVIQGNAQMTVGDTTVLYEKEKKVGTFPYAKTVDPENGVTCYRYNSSISCIK